MSAPVFIPALRLSPPPVHERLALVADRYDAIGLHRCAETPRAMIKDAKTWPALYANFTEQLERHVAQKEEVQ